jgi:hypothetical protein
VMPRAVVERVLKALAEVRAERGAVNGK